MKRIPMFTLESTMTEFRPRRVWHSPMWKSVALYFAASVCSGQSPVQPLAPGVIVLGQCIGRETAPGCVLPDLFGPGRLDDCE